MRRVAVPGSKGGTRKGPALAKTGLERGTQITLLVGRATRLSSLKQGAVYLKADARVPYQKMITVLNALQGRSVVLLTAPVNANDATNVPPYGLKVTVANQ